MRFFNVKGKENYVAEYLESKKKKKFKKRMSPETTERVSLSIIVVNGQSHVSSVLREIREGKKVFAFAEVLVDGRALSPRGDPEP